MMLPLRWNWHRLFSYGEVVCFVTAWAVGLLMAVGDARPTIEPTAVRSFAISSDVHGVQATLHK